MIEEEERKRIAEDLHDHIGQNLAISKIRLKTLEEKVPASSEEIQNILELIDDSISFTRTLTFELSPPVLYQLGLVPAIEWLAEQFRLKHGINIEVVSDENIHMEGGEKNVILFKTVRELLHNVVKHAHASKTTITIKMSNNNLNITIEDDGVGFDRALITNYKKKDAGFGIFSMQERIQYINGNVYIESKQTKGTKIEIIVPV